MSENNLIIITGPTAIGKTSLSIRLAKYYHTEIINADSRQVYREIVIGTAVPSARELSEVQHHFLGHRSIHELYNASQFENEVIAFLNQWFINHKTMIMVGGSGMYIDAVCRGIDELPSIDPEVRKKIQNEFHSKGLEGIQLRLKADDPVYFSSVDLNNPHRIMKALEIMEMTGRPYSSFLTGKPKQRNFNPVKIGLDMTRAALHERINNRVDGMMQQGLLDEAIALLPFKHLNALNTVGYKELFEFIEGKFSLDEAIEKIKGHSRQYARRQLTWFRRDKDMHWFHPDEYDAIIDFLTHPDGVDVPRRGGNRKNN